MGLIGMECSKTSSGLLTYFNRTNRLNLRTRQLYHILELYHILSVDWAGFRSKRSCADHLFSLLEICRSRRSQGKKTFLAFIDVQKAYDTVWREGVWRRMDEIGICGRMKRVLWGLYDDVRSSVRIGDRLTETFSIDLGVRQGCVLSPILFSIFLDGLILRLKALKIGIHIGGRGKGKSWVYSSSLIVSSLFFADDIVLMADNASDLSRLLDTVWSYSVEWKFRFNFDKTQIMVMGGVDMLQGSKSCFLLEGKEISFHMGETEMKVVKSYKYLGVEIQDDFKFDLVKKKLYKKAMFNFKNAQRMGIYDGTVAVPTGATAWKSLVRVMVEYSTCVWGEGEWKEVEVMQMSFGRQLLRVQTSTANWVVRAELGWVRMSTRRDLLRLLFFYRLVVSPSMIVLHVLLFSKFLGHGLHDKLRCKNWAFYTRKLLEELQLSEYWNGENMGSIVEWKSLVKEKLLQREQDVMNKDINNMSRLELYKSYKFNNCTFETCEPYLQIHNRIGRILWTQLRAGSLEVANELGRRTKVHVPVLQRICKFCHLLLHHAVEDDFHVVMICSTYTDLRVNFIKAASRITPAILDWFDCTFGVWLFDCHYLFVKFVSDSFVQKGDLTGDEVMKVKELFALFLCRVMMKRKKLLEKLVSGSGGI